MSLARYLLAACALAPLAGCGGDSKPARRVLVVTIDTLRWDRLGYMGYDVATPNLDALAASGTHFTDAVTVAPLTLPAHSSLFTGLYPPSHGVRTNGVFRLDDGVETMAEVFRDAGFATGAFVGSFVLESRFGLLAGDAARADVHQEKVVVGSTGDDIESTLHENGCHRPGVRHDLLLIGFELGL